MSIARELANSNPNATVEFSAEAATTTDVHYLEKVVKEGITAGADIINLPDTVGQRQPRSMYDFYRKAIGWAMQANPEVVISAHNHNDLGLASANTLALIEAAADYAHEHSVAVKTQAEVTICGLGERAGNTDVYPFAAQLFKFSPEMPTDITWSFNPEQSLSVAKHVLRLANMEIPLKSPIVGAETNVHRSGIHSHGVVNGGHEIYTPFSPVFWGHKSNAKHEDGDYQGKIGRHAIE